jgi:hypothetical protein
VNFLRGLNAIDHRELAGSARNRGSYRYGCGLFSRRAFHALVLPAALLRSLPRRGLRHREDPPRIAPGPRRARRIPALVEVVAE